MGESTERKTDLRILKTRDAIEGAFTELLGIEPYDTITVTAIAKKARISRKTFYLHYSSIEELLKQLIYKSVKSFAEEIRTGISERPIPEILNEFSMFVLTSLRNHRYLDDTFSKNLPLGRLLELVKEPLIEECTIELRRRGIPEAKYTDYWIAYYLGGLCSIYENWKLSESSDSLEDIAAAISNAATSGLKTILAQNA